jgi:hypothetical protein
VHTEARNNPAHPRPGQVAEAGLRLTDTRVINVLLAVGAIAAFVGYLALNTQASTKGFTIRALEKRISALEEEGQRLSIEAVANQTMGSIDGRIQGMGFVPVAAVEYVAVPGGVVAVK